jgi:hypothetical protein
MEASSCIAQEPSNSIAILPVWSICAPLMPELPCSIRREAAGATLYSVRSLRMSLITVRKISLSTAASVMSSL